MRTFVEKAFRWICEATTNLNRVALYYVEPRSEQNIRLKLVSNYLVFRQEILQRATLKTVVMSSGQSETPQIFERSPQISVLCLSSIDHRSPWLHTDLFLHVDKVHIDKHFSYKPNKLEFTGCINWEIALVRYGLSVCRVLTRTILNNKFATWAARVGVEEANYTQGQLYCSRTPTGSVWSTSYENERMVLLAMWRSSIPYTRTWDWAVC